MGRSVVRPRGVQSCHLNTREFSSQEPADRGAWDPSSTSHLVSPQVGGFLTSMAVPVFPTEPTPRSSRALAKRCAAEEAGESRAGALARPFTGLNLHERFLHRQRETIATPAVTADETVTVEGFLRSCH